MMLSILSALGLLLQAPSADDLKRLSEEIGAAEKMGMVHPDLQEACGRLASLAEKAGKAAPKELHDRLRLLKAQASVVGALHSNFTAGKGTVREIRIVGAKPERLRVAAVKKNGVSVDRGTGEQDVSFQMLDPEWLGTLLLAAMGTPELREDLGLYLAQAGRFEGAFPLLAGSDSPHPLVAETIRRGVEGARAAIAQALKSKNYAAAVRETEKVTRPAPEAAFARELLADLRRGLTDAARWAAWRQSKDFDKILPLLKKSFEDMDQEIEILREEQRWTLLEDPAVLGLKGKPGEPFLVDSGEESAASVYHKDPKLAVTGIAARIRVPKGDPGLPGFAWSEGKTHFWVDPKVPCVLFGHRRPDRSVEGSTRADVEPAEAYDLMVTLDDGKYVLRCNGKSCAEVPAPQASMKGISLNVGWGKATFEFLRIRKAGK